MFEGNLQRAHPNATVLPRIQFLDSDAIVRSPVVVRSFVSSLISLVLILLTITSSTMSIFANPLNTALLPPILYLLYRIFFPSYPKKVSPASSHNDAYNWSPKAHLPIVCKRKFSVKELEPFNGRDGPGSSGDGRILLAIARIVDGRIKERTVFDVTKGRNFYGPGKSHKGFSDSRWDVWQLCGPRRVTRYGQAVVRRG